MEKHPVALIPITTYDQAAVNAAVLQGVDLLGGIARFVQPEERVLLKPNLLSRALPQKAITTHPAVFSAVCRLLRESGYTHLSYGDSPGNPTTSPDKAAQASGIAEAAKRYGVEMADFFSGSVVPFPDGHTAKSFYLCKGVQDADAMINICKMKPTRWSVSRARSRTCTAASPGSTRRPDTPRTPTAGFSRIC